MATTRRGRPPGSKNKKPAAARGKRAAKPVKNGKGKGNVVLGPVTVQTIRVPINAVAYGKKESEIAQLEIQVKVKERAIAPTKIEIRRLNKLIDGLTEDLEKNTEAREEKVRLEMHYNTNEVRVLRASDKKELERRTMTAEERKRTSDIEDEVLDEPVAAGKADAIEEEDAATEADESAHAAGGQEETSL